jgi:hypothetical protein
VASWRQVRISALCAFRGAVKDDCADGDMGVAKREVASRPRRPSIASLLVAIDADVPSQPYI